MIPFVALDLLLTAPRPLQAPVAVGGAVPATWADLQRDVQHLRAWLHPRPEQRWGLYCDDAYAAAVALLALLHEGRLAVLPPNGQPGTLAELATQVDGLLADVPLPPLPLPTLAPLAAPATSLALPPPAPLPLSMTVMELATSGSAGERKVVDKSLGQLAAEVAMHEALWGSVLAGSTVLGTVSHQHIYGLLFRLLGPLCAGRPFHRQALVFPDRLAAAIAACAPVTVISCPAHLDRLLDLAELPAMAGRVNTIFSSGSLLSAATARRYAALLGQAPIEVLGATETGGVAWRRQTPATVDAPWQPLPGVTLRMAAPGADDLAQALRVCSPYASSRADEWVPMGDLAELLPDGRLRLLGRGDRIVKVGGKRLALPEVEDRLRTHPWVADCAALTLPVTGAAPRDVVAVVAVLTAAGQAALQAQGRSVLAATLRGAVAPFLADVHLPKRWRYVATLPVDAQGKCSLAALRALFAQPAGDLAVAPPEIVSCSVAGPRLHLALRVPPTPACCAGHFPAFPIVPGVVQLDWVMQWAVHYLDTPAGMAGIEALKYQSMLRPGDRAEADLEWQPGSQKLVFHLTGLAGTFSSGRLLLRPRTTSSMPDGAA